MRGSFKRKISGFVFIVAVCLVASQSQAVEFAGGTGESNNPYQIATAQQLQAIGDSTIHDKNFVLVADIDLDPNLSGNDIVVDNSFIDFFGGILDGNGHRISNMVIVININKRGMYYGFIRYITSGAVVEDIQLRNITIRGVGYYVGVLVGRNEGEVLQCSVTESVCGGDFVGGLVGENFGDIVSCSAFYNVVQGERWTGGLVSNNSGYISNCYMTGTVNGRGALGGLVGVNRSNISDCYAEGTVTGEESVGGLVGSNISYISNCYATGTITGSGSVGGLIGGNYGVISNCYATGSIAGEKYVGGLIGNQDLYDTATNPIVFQCYAACEIIADSNDSIGGLIGKSIGQTTDSFWDFQISGQKISAGGIGLPTAKLQDSGAYLNAGWDMVGETSNGVADIWTITEPNIYPQLTRFTDQYTVTQLSGSGTANDPYQISTAEELVAINDYDVSAHYSLVADIDMSGMVWATAPISFFNGTLDGWGYTISNLNIKGSDYLGLFGKILTKGVVTNLTIQDACIIGNEYVGVFAGVSSGHITNCHVTGSVTGYSWVGGLVGLARIYIPATFEDYVSDCTTDVVLSGKEFVQNVANVSYYD